MDSDEENRVLFYRKVKPHREDGFDQMIEEDQGFDRESSDELQKMRGKPFSSSSELHKAKSKIKTNGASGSGSSVRVCDFCGKQFSSGKALGGHRRYHIQAQRKMEAHQQQEKVNRLHLHHNQYPSNNYTLRIKHNNNNVSEDFINGGGGGGGDDDNNLIKSNAGNLNSSSRPSSFRCVVCDKDFPSKKSLFGHMRSHPEREWRGMNPPFTDINNALTSSSAEQFKVVEDDQYHNNNQNNNNNGSLSSSLEESSVVVDLSSSCSGSSWVKKDRRGRRSIGAAEAAQTLMYMYLYGDNYIHLLPPRELQPPAATELLPVKKRKKNNVNHLVGSSSPGKKQRLDDCQEKLEEAENENNIWDMKVMNLMKEKKLKRKFKKKMIKSEEAEAEGELLIRTLKEQVKLSSLQSYVCSICNKSFSSFQALGGHTSKHNREKNIVIRSKGKEAVELQREEEEDKVCINGALSSAAGLSCEEEPEEEEEGAFLISSEERLVLSSNDHDENNSNQEASHESGGSKILDFDLNVPYVSEQEATEI